nr:hypothetical protein [Gammaproteobacteria bacterium]
MKKILHIFVLLLTTLLLVSCQVERIETTTGEAVEQTTTKEEVITTTTTEEVITTTTTKEEVTTTTTEEPISIKELILSYLKEVSESFGASPYSFIPDPMKPAYKANLVSAESINYDFSDFVNKEDIVYGGFGEQWNMVIENIDDSEKFYNTLLKGD